MITCIVSDDEALICQEVIYSIISQLEEPDETNVFDIYDIRRTKSIGSIASTDVGDLSAFSDEDSICLEPVLSDPDSDVEFDRYLEQTAKWRKKIYIHEHAPHLEHKRGRVHLVKEETVQDDYEIIPNLNALTINCKSDMKVTKLGVVKSLVGCVAVVIPEVSVTLDLDTVVFMENKEVLGRVVDVLGSVKEPMYCIKSSDKEMKPGDIVFFALGDNDLTRTILNANLTTPWQKENVKNGADDEDDDILFSDDEEERAYQRNKNSNKNVQSEKGPRKRSAGKVQFNVPNDNKSNNRGRGGGRGSWNWNQRGGRKTYMQYEYPSDMNKETRNFSGIPPVNAKETTNEARPRFSYLKANRKPNTTEVPNNPYPELGGYDEFLR